ncbi:3-isopropylmalate dehydratase small subunit [Parafrigoribacterium soli]|uniref:3-isopropylmalate dehydratase small subunit n=1 Tax=Parafrigoribacterium soli TaxID=3144663 RepID=UPI0032F047EF
MSDQRVERVVGQAVAIRGDDIDTDQIMPARFLKWITFAGMEAHVFEDARLQARESGTVHPLDVPRVTPARILVVNRNFGCGSSREHAPQGLQRAGIAAIVGESFGEIFAGNCLAIGVPCAEIEAEAATALQQLCENHPDTSFALDLHSMTVSAGGTSFAVRLREGRRRQLLAGTWDSTALLLEVGDEVDRILLA